MPKKKTKADATQQMFRDPSGQVDFLQKSLEEELASKGPVECLGMTFENDEKRREYFLQKLREKLKDPEFRKIEGFPIGEDEDILALSDPPYYTACPNPFLSDFIKHYAEAYAPGTAFHMEPFASDVTEGKSDAIYNAHRYHTKVPPRAILRYLLHYTKPGDLVLDGFAGTGMVGVAAQMCGNPDPDFKRLLESESTGTIEWGSRVPILIDLSPIATFIAYNQNSPINKAHYEQVLHSIVQPVTAECAWMYDSKDKSGHSQIYHTVWSEVLICPSCSQTMVFWDQAVDQRTGDVKEEFPCPHCGAISNKRQLVRATETVIHPVLRKSIKQAQYVPVAVKKMGHRADTKPNESDLAIIQKVQRAHIPYWYPTAGIERDIDMWYERDYRSLGLLTLDSFYTPRNLWVFSSLWDKALKLASPHGLRSQVLFTLTAMAVNLSKMNCWRFNVSFPYNPISGTLYVGALPVESNVILGVQNKGKRLARIWSELGLRGLLCASTQSSASVPQLPNNCIDYVFTDPPFGSNIIYSDLSLLYEAWLRVETNIDAEAVVHRRKKTGRSLDSYRELMCRCFKEYARVLKPGRWLTMVFHNTKNSVWNAIQEALGLGGLVVADVRILDKKQGSFKQLTAAGAVKQDLVISAYKPNAGLEERFRLEAGTEEGVWDFTRTHLKQLPVFVAKDGQAEAIAERQGFLLFDRMVAFHVQRGVTVPVAASAFYAGLLQRFPERDGMFFLPDQVAEYDKKRMTVKEVLQLEVFITDEATAIEWLKQQLTRKTQTFQEIHPQFMREIGGWHKHERPLELLELLGQNFLRYDGDGDVPSQIHSYLSTNFKECRKLAKDDPALQEKARDRWYVPDPNKAGDLERLREKALLREFWEYLPPGYAPAKAESAEGYIPGMEPKPGPVPRGKKMKIIRMEAVRAGFKQCWQSRDYRTIIAVAQRIPEDVLQEDPKLLMWYDQALTRTGGEQ